MIRPVQVSVATILVAATVLAWGSSARAEETTSKAVVQPVPPPAAEVGTRYAGPNRSLIGTGLFLFGASYIPVAIVAGISSHPGDQHLYVPVAGPWLDIADRGRCAGPSLACDIETSNKIGLAISGVFQGLGVLAVLGGFAMPEEQTVANSAQHKPSVHVAPARMGQGGYGITAFGEF
jgi:hypothetical protein